MSEIGSGWAEPDVFTGPLFEILKRHPKRIVFSEGEDKRVIQVADEMVRLGIGVPILLGNREKILSLAQEMGAKMQFVKIIDPTTADDLDLFTERLIRVEKLKGRQARESSRDCEPGQLLCSHDDSIRSG